MVADVVVVDGGGAVGGALASRIAGDDEVVFLDENEHAVERASGADIDARVMDDTRADVFDDDAIERAEVALVVSPEDGRNLLVGQFLRINEVERVIALVNDPANLDAFAGAGIEPVCVTSTLTGVLDARRREPRATPREHAAEPATESHETAESHETESETTRTDDRERIRTDGGRIGPNE